MFLLNHYHDQVRTTVFRQAMFAEFERDAHGVAERQAYVGFLCVAYPLREVRPSMTMDEDFMEARFPTFNLTFTTPFGGRRLSSGIMKGEGEGALHPLLKGQFRLLTGHLREVMWPFRSPAGRSDFNFQEKTALENFWALSIGGPGLPGSICPPGSAPQGASSSPTCVGETP